MNIFWKYTCKPRYTENVLNHECLYVNSSPPSAAYMRQWTGSTIHNIIYGLDVYFLNIVYFFKYPCTNIFHRRSLCTFYWDQNTKRFI